MKKALIQGSDIWQVEDAEFPVHPDLSWVDVPDDTTSQDTYVGGAVVKFVPYVMTTAEAAQYEITRIENSDEMKRTIRDAILDIDHPGNGKQGKVRLQELEDLLDIERAKL